MDIIRNANRRALQALKAKLAEIGEG